MAVSLMEKINATCAQGEDYTPGSLKVSISGLQFFSYELPSGP